MMIPRRTPDNVETGPLTAALDEATEFKLEVTSTGIFKGEVYRLQVEAP